MAITPIAPSGNPSGPATPADTSPHPDNPMSSIDDNPEYRRIVACLQAEMASVAGRQHTHWNNNIDLTASVDQLAQTLNKMVQADYRIEEGGMHPHHVRPDAVCQATQRAFMQAQADKSTPDQEMTT